MPLGLKTKTVSFSNNVSNGGTIATITPSQAAALRITVGWTDASGLAKLTVDISNGTDTHTYAINNDVALTDGALHTFTLGARPAYSYVFKAAGAAVTDEYFACEEISGGTL
jgi:hypothetical protein